MNLFFNHPVPPVLDDSSPTAVSAYIGDTVSLSCVVLGGIPQPAIRWLKDSFLVNVDGEKVRESADEETLVLEDAMVSDSGEYMCEVNNGVDEAIRRQITLTVLGMFCGK